MKQAKKHLVGKDALDQLIAVIEGIVKANGYEEEWLDHIRKRGMDETYLSTDYDWPLRMAVWYLEGR